MRPRSVTTARTRFSDTSISVTRVSAWKTTPDAWASLAIASAALTALPIPSDGTYRAPATRSETMGTSSINSRGPISSASIP